MNLKKLLLICLSALSIPAFAQIPDGLTADWFIVARSVDKKDVFYANRKTISRNGDIVKAWIAHVDEQEKKSSKQLLEINCKTQKERILSITIFKNTTFSDTLGSLDNPRPWIHIVPDSVGHYRAEMLCAFKPTK